MTSVNLNMPFDEYKAYIESKTWDQKRTERLIFDNFQCQICGNRNNIQVHHLVYPIHKNYGNEPIFDLITLCAECHMNIDKLRKGQKVKILKKYVNASSAYICIKFYNRENANSFVDKILNNKDGNIHCKILFEEDGNTYMRVIKCALNYSDIYPLRQKLGEENVKFIIEED